MKPTPPGWPRIAPAVFYIDPAAAIDWLCNAFGFGVRMKVEGPDGRIEHSELELGAGLIMVAGAGPKYRDRDSEDSWKHRCASPSSVDGHMTQSLCIYVDDVDAHCRIARAAGAEICHEPATTDYGKDYWVDRGYAARDPEGHVWWFVQRLSTSDAETARRQP